MKRMIPTTYEMKTVRQGFVVKTDCTVEMIASPTIPIDNAIIIYDIIVDKFVFEYLILIKQEHSPLNFQWYAKTRPLL